MVNFWMDYPPLPINPRAKRKPTLSNTWGLNAYYSGKHYQVRRKDAEYWHMWTRAQLNKQRIPKRIYTKPVQIIFSWDDGLDCSNHAVMAKMIEDALIGYLIQGDSRKYVKFISHGFNNQGKIHIRLEEVA